MTTLGLSADELLTTTRAVRKRIDFDRPVDNSVLLDCVEIAHQAPTGSNRQGWRWLFVTDEARKQTIADYYRAAFYPYIEALGTDLSGQDRRIQSSAVYLAERLHEIPVMAIPLHHGRLEGANNFYQASAWGSILPAVWSFLLALRERGLGSSWTTLHLQSEREIAELLGVPFDDYAQVGLFPIGYTLGVDFKQATRVPASEFVHWNEWSE